MIFSIKTKLIIVVTALVLFILTVTASLLISEKKMELTHDIFLRARSFSELTADDIVQEYELFLKSGGFLYFQSRISDIFLKNEDISAIMIANYRGDLLYDSSEDKTEQYRGDVSRQISDSAFLARIQSQYPSFSIGDGSRVMYMKRNLDQSYQLVDFADKPVVYDEKKELVRDIVYPVQGKYAIRYDVTYKNLDNRISAMTERIRLLMLFGIMAGLLTAYVFSFTITRHLGRLVFAAQGVAAGDFKQKVVVKSRDEIGILADAFNSMAKDLDQSTKARLYKARMGKELELAAQIQRDLLPERIPDISGLDIAAGLIPAEEIGGDCFDFIHVNKEDTILYIGDVTGHGVPSGLVGAVANAIVYSKMGSRDIRDLLIETNSILKMKTRANMFLTMLMVNWNSRKKALTYVSAGHERMIQLEKKTKKAVMLEGGGMALGMLPDISKLLVKRSVALASGDALFLYSDGIPDARSKKGELYGRPRLLRSIEENVHLGSAEALKNAVLSDVKEFSEGRKIEDDITILVLRRG
ncbi:SpoIIE family protein phosphatase [Candidatus Peregrinibacteria bacterium]|nr:SpoIIE family protein phosphatase [Candidatus Peregrinibacteria bacterium]